MFDIDPLEATFGATVRGVPQAALDDASFRAIHAAGIELGLLIFPGQLLTREQQAAFTLRFGALEFSATRISDIARDGSFIADPDDDVVKGLRGNEGWHHASTYMPMQAKGAVFSAEIVPSDGAATGWADIRAALKRSMTTPVNVLPSCRRSTRSTTPRDAPACCPRSGTRTAVTGRTATTKRSRRCDRRLMHRATPFDLTEPRRMWHTRIAGEPQSELAVSHF